MKTLFVSVPMKGRTEEEIKKSIDKMKKIAEIYEGEELELIDSYVEHKPPHDSKEAIWHLSKSIEKLAQADLFIGIQGDWLWSGCEIERNVAQRYGIKTYSVDATYVVDNYLELLREMEHVCPL